MATVSQEEGITMGVMIVVLGNSSAEKVCFKCKEPLEPTRQDDEQDDDWRWFQAVYRSRQGHRYCHKCYKRWLPENER